jgi:hypothetical protein
MSTTEILQKKDLVVDRRTLIQNATLAIRDVYDAIVELVTNADDRYQILDRDGRIEIEVEERRGGKPSILRVRDFADGMTSLVMDQKLSRMGGRVSGLESGAAVRGTNSRGAKDVAALGHVTFESIAADGRVHKCRITPFMEFELCSSVPATEKLRKKLGITEGTGTVVTIEIDPKSNHQVPRHDALLEKVASLVRMREIIRDPRRIIIMRRTQQGREDQIRPPVYEGKKRVSVRFEVPGYDGIDAKLLIYRAPSRFERAKDRFRLGGILVKSRHAVHEATLFDPSLESDPNALWFYGRLSCEAIDDLWNAFDNRYAKRLAPLDSNPVPILDPSRKSGLTRDHPFVLALYDEALKRLRPLVEEERRREEHVRSKVENKKTRRRLDALEKAANDFMKEWMEQEDEDTTRDKETYVGGKRFQEHGFTLNPPFAQLVKGHSAHCSLAIRKEAFPEIELGATVQVECLTNHLEADSKFVALEQHPAREGVLRAKWKVKAAEATPATGFRTRVGPIVAESTIEVFECEADRYRHIDDLMFTRKRYRIRTDRGRKKVQVLAPLKMAREHGTELQLTIDGDGYTVKGDSRLSIMEELGIARSEFHIKCVRDEPTPGKAKVSLGEFAASAEIVPVDPPGAGIHITLEDVDHGSMRYRWKKNELEVAARHPSLARYLGSPSEGFPGQEERHFRVLLGEIVADAVCSELLRKNIEANPADYENADWDLYYAEFSEYMTAFLPTAHALVVPDPR